MSRGSILPAVPKMPSLLVAAMGVAAAEILLNFGRLWSDSGWYIRIAETGNAPDAAYRIRFMLPLMLSPVVRVFGAQIAFGLANTIFWVATLAVIYKCSKLIGRADLGPLAVIFYSSSVAMIAYGASVLTDPPAYFFVGLSLYVVLLLSESAPPSRVQLFLGMFLTIGVFFHPVTFFSLAFVLGALLMRRKLSVHLLAGIGLMMLLGILIALGMRVYEALPQILSSLQYRVIVSPSSELFLGRAGPPLPEVVLWSFGITAPLDLIMKNPHVPFAWGTIVRLAIFLCILVLGFHELRVSRTLLEYLPFLAGYVVLIGVNIERYLFVLWPVLVFPITAGLLAIAENLISMIRQRLMRNGGGLLANPSSYAALYLLVQAFANSVVLIPLLGVPWLTNS